MLKRKKNKLEKKKDKSGNPPWENWVAAHRGSHVGCATNSSGSIFQK
jgi:hypothetical protein